jgi:UDP-N-acetylglucosamine transferase subunit ALG13
MKKKLTKKSKENLIIQGESDTMLNASTGFWLAEFDRLMELRDRMEKSDERFDLNFTEKINSIESQIAVVVGHMGVELSAIKKANSKWLEIEDVVYEYES